MRHAVLDDERRVAMLAAAHEKRAGQIETRALAGEGCVDLIAGEARSRRELEGAIASIGLDVGEPGDEMERPLGLALQLRMGEARLIANADLGHRISLDLGLAKCGIAFDELERGAGT